MEIKFVENDEYKRILDRDNVKYFISELFSIVGRKYFADVIEIEFFAWCVEAKYYKNSNIIKARPCFIKTARDSKNLEKWKALIINLD